MSFYLINAKYARQAFVVVVVHVHEDHSPPLTAPPPLHPSYLQLINAWNRGNERDVTRTTRALLSDRDALTLLSLLSLSRDVVVVV